MFAKKIILSTYQRYVLFVFTLIFTVFANSALADLPKIYDGQLMPSLAPMIQKVRPAVVNIATRGHIDVASRHPQFNNPLFKRFFEGLGNIPQRKEVRSLGSGVIIDATAGYIVTNYHVIEGADKITVTLSNGDQVEAKLIGADSQADVAVLQIHKDHLTQLPFADSSKLRVGDFAVAVGNPFGLGQTVTSGIISALGRTGLGIEGYEDFIQTDASINPGNSGGALVNLKGQLIGMNTAILSAGTRGNIGIGFAIPINMVRQISDQLIQYGDVHRGMLGVVMQNLTPELSKAFGMDLQQGVVISQVIEHSAAKKAGMKVGDVVEKIDGKTVKSASQMRNMVGMMRVGQKMSITVIRNGKEMHLNAIIQNALENTVAGEKLNPLLKGAMIKGHVEPGKDKYLEITAVTRGSAAWGTGLRKGDLILSVNRTPVTTIDELKKVINMKDKQVLLNIQRGQTALFVLIQ